MQHRDLPERWQQKIEEYLKLKGEGHKVQLGASDFPVGKIVKLNFEDGSKAEFLYALVIEAPELGEVGIFTEHCGYHIFTLSGLNITLTNTKQV